MLWSAMTSEPSNVQLADKVCVPCRGGVPPMPADESASMLAQLDGGWEIVDDHHLHKTYKFKNFREALDFTNRVGELAESVFHHPDITLAWGKVSLDIWTHKINGLNEADFIFAAKCDKLLEAPAA